jgi:hypothetical protein
VGNLKLILFRPLGKGATEVQAAINEYPDWKVLATIVPTESGPTLAQLLVRPVAPDLALAPAGGIPTRLLRKVTTGELLDLATSEAIARQEQTSQLLAYASDDPSDAVSSYLRSWVESTSSLSATRKRPGRAGHGVEHYAAWAQLYVKKIEAREPHPIAALAKDTGKTETYIRDTITDARRRHKLLTKPGQGKAGGMLTPKALKIIAEMKTKEG